MNHSRSIGVTILLSLLAPGMTYAYSCEQRTPAETFESAERLFLVRVIETRAESADQFGPELSEDGPFHLISAGYEIVEEFKGEADHRPRFLQILHFTGIYPNLTPGVFYLIAVDPTDIEADMELPWSRDFALITMCEVITAYLPEDLEDDTDGTIADTLATYRGLRDVRQ